MRFHRPLDDVLRGRAALGVLRTLTTFRGKEFTGREVAELSGVSASKAIVELNRLRANGAVERRAAGRSQLWRAVEEHALFAMMRPALAAEARVLAQLRETLASTLAHPKIEEAYLFGSVARGEEDAASDVDVLLVVGKDEDKEAVAPAIARASEAVRARFGNPLHALVYARSQLARKRRLPAVREALEGIRIVEADA